MSDDTHNPFPAVVEGMIGGQLTQTVNARRLHASLGNRDHFTSWFRDRVRQYGFSKDIDFIAFSESTEKGRPSDEYAITLDMAKELAMVERNDKGKAARAYFIACERKLRERPDPLAALNDAATMRGYLLTYAERVIALEAEKAEMEPKVAALDRIAESFGSLCLRDAAKTLQIPPNVLTRWLIEHKWIYRRTGSDNWIAYQPRLTSLHLTHKTHTYKREDGTEGTSTQVRVTPKGMTVLGAAFPPVARVA